MHEARFWQPLSDHVVQCTLCRFACRIHPGKTGLCHVRLNQDGILYTQVYGQLVAQSVDPIEKKPLYHVLPGHASYSIATVGCNFQCRHCQNDHISQPPFPPFDRSQPVIAPQTLVETAVQEGCRSIAYTYTEPTIYIEYLLDVSRIARQSGLLNLWVTNGYITEEALREVAPLIDAANIDLKGFDEEAHRQLTGASLEGVKQTLLLFRALGVWLEVTTLLIPSINDSEAEITAMAQFIARELGADTPWHLTAFYPAYRMQDRPPTSVSTLRRAQQIARAAGLRYVYLGNVPASDGRSTRCPRCDALVIERNGWQAQSRLADGHCHQCTALIPGLWNEDEAAKRAGQPS